MKDTLVLFLILLVLVLGTLVGMSWFWYEVGKEQEARRVWREERAREEMQRLQMEKGEERED